MGEPVVPVALQAAAYECSLQPAKESRYHEEDQAQGSRDADGGTDVAGRSSWSGGEEDSREGDGDGDGEGEAR